MIPLQHRRAWIFDLDGTLTQPVHNFLHIRQELGIDPADDILATIAAQPEHKRQDMTERLDKLEHYYAAQAKPAPGVLILLEHLADLGCEMGILTRNTRAIAIESLAAIGAKDFFKDELVLGRDEAHPKPDAQGIALLLNHWQRQPEEAVMVGDFRYDLESGRAAGTYTVHVDDSDRHWPDLTDLRVPTLHELAHHLKNVS
ncbi:HAD family hydrolase [Pontibacterium granulatum]|uniref:HAD family hydrolase n=1 Tax=Pontibacterium granulatum TaxID=2036029 RepID=UPI00249A8B84|nr:HAD family hydrolase [Pontibacterium granulatum]MDI3326834.1 HAD family hydrolase [Pontibacterium granulatum]